MSEKPKNNCGLAIIAATLLLIPPLYVLSVGPVDALCNKGIISAPPNGVVFWFYAPLRLVCDNCKPFHDMVMTYSEWCSK